MTDSWVHLKSQGSWESPMHVSIDEWKVDTELDRVFYKVIINVKGFSTPGTFGTQSGATSMAVDSTDAILVAPRTWTVWKSYRQFLELKNSLGLRVNLRFESSFPRKSFFRQRKTKEEIEVRRHMLEEWLKELCQSEEFVHVSYKIVLSQLNVFFHSAEHGGDIVFFRNNNSTSTTRAEGYMDSANTNSSIMFSSIGLSKSASRSSLFSTYSGGAGQDSDVVSQKQHVNVDDEGAAVTKGASYPDIFGSPENEYSQKKRYFFHRLLLPLLAPAQNKLVLPITIPFLTEHLPCKVDLMSVLGTVEGGFIPECCNRSATKAASTRAEDESLHQLGKDFSRDRVVVQGVKITGFHISLDELIELSMIQARQCIYNTAVAHDMEMQQQHHYNRQIGLVNTDSVDRESSVYDPNEFFGDDGLSTSMDYADAYMYGACARTNSVGLDGVVSKYVIVPPLPASQPQRMSPPRGSPNSSGGSGSARVSRDNSCSSAPFVNSVPRLPGYPSDYISPSTCSFIDMENQAAISSTCADAGIFDDLLRAFVVHVLFTASRTNSAYHANIALQIMLGVLQLPTNEVEAAVESRRARPMSPGIDGDNGEEEDQGEIIISPDSALARPIYLEFTWKQLPLPDCTGSGDTSDLYSAYGQSIDGESTVDPAMSAELVWCLVCDIKCATVYKLVNSNDIETVLLQCKTTYYKQVILTANPQSPLNYTQVGGNINTGAWLFLDKDVKLTDEHMHVWISDV